MFWKEAQLSCNRLFKEWHLYPHSGLDAVALVDAEEVLENTQNSLEELWRLDYPQARMAHLLEVIANQLSRYVQVKGKNWNREIVE